MDLMFGLSVVDQMNGGRQTKKLAKGWTERSSGLGGWLRQRTGAALIALGTRLAPAVEAPAERPALTGRPLAGSAQS